MTAQKIETTDLKVCVDCIMLLANGEVFNSDGDEITTAHADKIDALWGRTEIVPAGGEDDESHFSWQSCDGCGSTDGGDRFAAAALHFT